MSTVLDDLHESLAPYTEGLWAHQTDYVERHGMDREHALLWQPRVGKSLAVLRSIIRWHDEAHVRRVLLVAPKTVCSSVWAPLIAAEGTRLATQGTRLEPLQVLDLSIGTLVERKARLRACIESRRAGGSVEWEIALVNRDVLADLADALLKWDPQALILDELHDYKTPSSARARAAFRLGRHPSVRFRRGLTGTPASEGYESLYGQWKIVSPTTFGTQKQAFLDRYVVFDPYARYPKILGYRNVDELRQKAFKIASIVKRTDCFEIPPEHDVERFYDLPPEARRVYDTIVSDHVLELQNAADAKTELPLRHTFSRIVQLRQVAVGYARYWDPHRPDDENDKTVHWLHEEKLAIVKDEVEDIVESGEKVVVFHAFLPEREALMHALKEYHPLTLYGGAKDADRVRALHLFERSSEHPVIVVQESVGSLGISLAAANYAVFASYGLSRATHTQARDRIFKPAGDIPGKTLTTVYPLARDTIEVSIRKLHDSKRDAEEYLLSGTGGVLQNFVNIARGVVK
jgi:SNF2 family DNA or RNA helicase